MLCVLHDGSRIDYLAAHILGCTVNNGEAGGECVGAVDYAAVNAALGNLSGDFLDVGAVGDGACVCKSGLVKLVVGKDLLSVLAYGERRCCPLP